MLFVGFLFFALGTWWMTSLTRDWDFWELLWPQIFRGVGLMLAMVPINNVALGTLAPERVKNASGLYNLMRNLGGAVGLAGIYTFLNDRTDLHIARLHENFTFARRPAVEALNNMAAQARISYGSDAQAMALKQMTQLAHRQGAVMAFADVFFALTLLFVALAVLAVLVKRPAAAAGPAAGIRYRAAVPRSPWRNGLCRRSSHVISRPGASAVPREPSLRSIPDNLRDRARNRCPRAVGVSYIAPAAVRAQGRDSGHRSARQTPVRRGGRDAACAACAGPHRNDHEREYQGGARRARGRQCRPCGRAVRRGDAGACA